ncbi:MAG TPA: amylo-alpha-1,6-glucosidase [candidate division Zixibacteria bacterium]|nr:amylo-alpha-1,6-glucosidase [candidate division Zixibacteria bacterium]
MTERHTQVRGDLPKPLDLIHTDPLVHHSSYDIQVEGDFGEERDQVLKHAESFAVFDRHGDVQLSGAGEEGIYHRGTRHLSGLQLLIAGRRPLLLGSIAKRDNSRLAIDLTNGDLGEGPDRIGHGSVHLQRTKVLWDGVLYERWTLRNFALRKLRIPLTLRFAADFADVFEIRGIERPARGRRLSTLVSERSVVLRYIGLDGVIRRTRITFSRSPDLLEEGQASFHLELPDAREVTIEVSIACETGARRKTALPPASQAFDRARRHLPQVMRGAATVYSSNELFNEWLDRSVADVAMLTSRTRDGLFPYAGVPWFSAPFGRDALVVGLQMLWMAPHIARGVLGYLAARQATEVDAESDAEPGKILHEAREGEMAGLGEVPFRRYYGSHDATPLFVMLAAAHWRQTDDTATVRRLWPHVERALEWMDTYGDHDGDGFLDYRRHRPDGLVHQGWKDSNDSIFHADGRLAEGPIALCELQGYAYAARQGAAELAEVLGHDERAAQLRAQAADLRRRFDEAFWDEELNTYVLALDGHGRPCRVRASNAGHALLTGIALPERADRVAATLMEDRSFSGWGVRTVAAGEARYNPMSYHNGSIWPHDNGLVAMGLARYGHHAAAARILTALFEASRHFELARLPELFCGFSRREGEGPTRYPVACAPQAWAAGSVFMLLQASLGMEIDAPRRQVRFSYGRLPEFMEQLRINGLQVAEASVDLELERHTDGVGLRVVARTGNVDVVVVK